MTANTETAILSRLIDPDKTNLSPEAARYILSMDFRSDDRRKMQELSEKAQKGTLDADEQAELDNYVRVGHLLALMQSKARKSLKRAGFAA
jgi:hypothetical protein